jgi:hypothetical protein
MWRVARRAIFVVLICALAPTRATAQVSAPSAAGVAKVKLLFSDKAFTDSKCEALTKDNEPVFECTYRGKGLQTVSTRGLIIREDEVNGDVFMVATNVAPLDAFPNTPDVLRKLLAFNLTMDFCKLSVSKDSTLVIWSLMKVSQLNSASDMEFMFDQVAACVSEFTTTFDKDKK